MPDIFLSYSRDDLSTARRFAEAFEREGFSVWWDQTLNPGEAFDEVTEKALNEARAVVVLWSKKSVASRWVRSEATQANDSKTLVPVMIEPCKRPIMFELTHTANLAHWNGDASDPAWQSYLAGVKRMVGKGEPNQSASPSVGIRRDGWRISAISLGILVAVLVIAGGILWVLNRKLGGQAAPIAAAAATLRDSVAVMPFANLTGDPSKDYLGDGMSEEIINSLAQVEGLKVPARTSTFAYKGRNTDIRQIGKELGVATVLEGSVRAAGKRIRITAQLINAQDGLHMWSKTYDEEFTDLFKLQDDLAHSIAEALQVKMNPGAGSAGPLGAPTQDLEAYQLYLQASAVADTANSFAEFSRALELLHQSLVKDPNFARAYALSATVRMFTITGGRGSPNALADAEREASRALALDPHLAQARAALGNIDAIRGKWLDAESNYRAAMAADPADGNIPLSLAIYVAGSVGQLRKALAEAQEAFRLSPANPSTSSLVGGQYSLMGLDEEAIKFSNLSTKLSGRPDTVLAPRVLGNAALRRGDFAAAADYAVVGLFPSLHAADGEGVIRNAVLAIPDSTRQAAASRQLQAMVAAVGEDKLEVITVKDLLQLYTSLGDVDQAYRLMNHVLVRLGRDGTVGTAWGGLWLPEMRPFRRDPRFQDLASRMNFMSYWQQYGPPDDCDLTNGKLTCH